MPSLSRDVTDISYINRALNSEITTEYGLQRSNGQHLGRLTVLSGVGAYFSVWRGNVSEER